MSLKLLIVDDEPDVLKVIKAMAEPWGYEIHALSDSQQALVRLEQEKFDGIVLDAMMPPPDGFELARQVRASALNGSTPVIMITGLSDVDTMRKCFAEGVTFFLNKPFTHERMYNLFNAVRGSMLRERQRSARLPLRTNVECRFGEFGEKHFRAESVNLGEGGMLLEPSGGLDVGQEVELEFSLPVVIAKHETVPPKPRRSIFAEPAAPEAGPRRIRARVLRKAPPDRVAVQFVSLAPQNAEVIRRFIYGRVSA